MTTAELVAEWVSEVEKTLRTNHMRDCCSAQHRYNDHSSSAQEGFFSRVTLERKFPHPAGLWTSRKRKTLLFVIGKRMESNSILGVYWYDSEWLQDNIITSISTQLLSSTPGWVQSTIDDHQMVDVDSNDICRWKEAEDCQNLISIKNIRFFPFHPSLNYYHTATGSLSPPSP